VLSDGALFSQEVQKYTQFTGQFETHQHKETYAFAKKSNNELEAAFSGLFLFYKSFLSSQDAISCVFYPSCSVYGYQAVQKHGVIRGIIETFDRLSRCHALSPEEYDIHPETHLFYDPVQ
jgi:putative membrane protein insertion efficiency factor